MSRTNFENLEVYQKAEELADAVWHVVARWDSFAKYTVGKQLVRAADSISANIAEGDGRGTAKERAYFFKVARGSLYETKNWLRRAHRRGLLSDEQIAGIKPLLDALPKMLNAYLRKLRLGSTSPKTHSERQ
ncbi:MAG: four helix bundle protein [Bacteroidota bacterium]